MSLVPVKVGEDPNEVLYFEVTDDSEAVSLERGKVLDGYNKAIESISKMCQKLKDSIKDMNTPDTIQIDLNFGFTIKEGEFTGALIKGGATGSIAVSLVWNNDDKKEDNKEE